MGKRTRFYVETKGYHEKVTGSCIENIITWPNGEKFCFLIDYGMYQEKEYEVLAETLFTLVIYQFKNLN